MSLKLLSISSMYQGSLTAFYLKNETGNLTYDEHYKKLIAETTEFAGAYTRTFINLGIDARCIITNDTSLQNKWKAEKKVTTDRNNELIFKQVDDFQPDILCIEDLNFLDHAWFAMVRAELKSIRLILAYHCAPFTRDLMNKLKNADVIITCTPGLKKIFENEGMKTHLVYHGFDTSLMQRIQKNKGLPENQFVFSGSLITGGSFHASRINLIEDLIKADIDITLYTNLEKQYKIIAKQIIFRLSEILKKLNLGKIKDKFQFFEYGTVPVKSYSASLLKKNRTPLFGIDMYSVFSDSRIVLNIHAGVAGNYAGNMRMFEVTGVGSCLLTDNKENMEDLFAIGKEVVVYDSPEDCVQKVKWLLQHEDERIAIAKAGQKRTLEMHTVENRCKTILDIITEELSQRNRAIESSAKLNPENH